MSARAETLSDLALSRGKLDRMARRRSTPDLLSEILRSPTTRVAELRGDRMELAGDALVLRAPAPGDVEQLALYLGADVGPTGPCTVDGVEESYVAVVYDDPPARSPRWQTLRQAGLLLSDRDSGIFTTAQALANWHRTHGFCPRCGASTDPVLGGWVRRCRADGSEHFPRTDPAVIMSVVDDTGRLLLGRARSWLPNRYSVLAGFVEPGESLEAAVAREVLEESGIRVGHVEYLGNQPWPFPSSLMIGCSARALDTDIRVADDEMADVLWIDRESYLRQVTSGEIITPGGISIARRLIERWLGRGLDDLVADPLRWS